MSRAVALKTAVGHARRGARHIRSGTGGVLPSQAEVVAVLPASSAMYDPSDLSTLWQDTARTTPVTADGQSVGAIDDVSGNGFHMIAQGATLPVYKTSGGLHWIEVNGAAWMVPASHLALGTVWAHIGAWQRSGTTGCPFTTSSTSQGALQASSSGNEWRWYNSANTLVEIMDGASNADAGTLTLEHTSQTELTTRYNGADADTIIPYNDGAFTHRLALFTRQWTSGVQTFYGRFYGGLFAPALLSVDDRAIAESFFAAKVSA